VNSTAKIENEKKLVDGFKEIFDDRLIDDISKEKLDIIDLLKVKNIAMNKHVSSWEEAIKISGELLLKNGYIKESYIISMIDIVKEYGAYIVISEGVALPHARNKDNVLKTGMSLLSLREPVIFPGDKKVDILISVSSVDNKEHLDSLVDLMELITEYDFKEKIKKMNTPNEVLKFIYKYKVK
jgi:mannitol/fructose-specific phosphotransferase system IIA component (Ntr-type)